MGWISLSIGAPARAETPDEAVDSALRLAFQGQIYEAKSELEKNASENPDHALSHSALAFVSIIFGSGSNRELERERERVEKALEIGPDNKWNHIALAAYHGGKYINGDLTAYLKMEKEAESARKLEPDAGEPYFLLWLTNKFFKNNAERADKAYRSAIHYQSKHVNLHYLFYLSESLLSKDCESAVSEALTAIEESPEGRALFLNWEGMGRGAGAIEDINIEAASRANCHYWKAAKYRMLGGAKEKIVTNLKQAVNAAPGFDYAFEELTELLLDSGRKEEVAALFADQYEKNPQYIGSASLKLCLRRLLNLRDATSQYIAGDSHIENLNLTPDNVLPYFYSSDGTPDYISKTINEACGALGGANWNWSEGLMSDVDVPNFCFAAQSSFIPSVKIYVGSTGTCPVSYEQFLENDSRDPGGCPVLGAPDSCY